MNEARQCTCGQWFSDTGRGHTTCKTCRTRRPATSVRRRATRATRATRTHQPAWGSQAWQEARGGLLGGYETDETYCPD